MAKHSAPSEPRSIRKKLAPSLVLGLTTLSVTGPLALIALTDRVQAESPTIEAMMIGPTTVPSSTRPTAQAVQATTAVLQKAKESVLPSSKRPRITTQTSKPVPTSEPEVAVSTRPRPTVAQRQIQKATTAPRTTQRASPSTTAPPRPTTVRQTTTQAPPPTPKPSPKPTPKPTPTPTKTTTQEQPPKLQSPSRQQLVSIAQKYVGRGIPYRMGGNSLTSGMDCSHFIWMVFKEAGYNFTYRDSAGLASWTTRVTDPQPGDLVLYRGHAGIYAGGGMMVHHGRDGGAFFSKVYTNNFIGYGRIPN